MDIRLSKKITLGALILVCIVFIIFSVAVNGYTPGPLFKFNGTKYKYAETYLKPIDPSPPDNLLDAESQYNNFVDSVKLRRRIKNGNAEQGGNSVSWLSLGTQADISCDTCGSNWFWSRVKTEIKTGRFQTAPVQSYLSLLGWKLKATAYENPHLDSVVFHVEHNQAYVRKYAIISPAVKGEKDSVYYRYGLIDEPVKFHYDPYDKSLLIPVSKTVTLTVSYFSYGIALILFCYALILIGIFIRFVLDISKGHVFTNKNLRTLRLIAITFLVSPVVMFIFNLLLGFIFRSYFTEDVVLSKATWIEAWKSISIGLIFLMLYKAFSQGKKLKEEQEFTI